MSRNLRGRSADERGITIVLVGVSLMFLMVIVAYVVDISMLRDDRRADQKIADAAASAGSLKISFNGVQACDAALDYLEANTPDVTSFAGADCSGFPVFCDPSTAAVTTTGTAGDLQIQIVYPVPNGHQLMTRASGLGAPAATPSAWDGSGCERLGVKVDYTRAASFGAVVGNGDKTTSVHAVAMANSRVQPEWPINLLILERTECDAVVAAGNTHLEIGAITGFDGEKLPGLLAVDSDGSGANCGPSSNGTLHAQGTSTYVHADGAPNCPWEVKIDPFNASNNIAGQGVGCGIIELFAPGVPGPAPAEYCANGRYRPACTNQNAVIRPHPVRMAERRTREPVDHLFNCLGYKVDGSSLYSDKFWFAEHPIEACDDATSDTDYVDELHAFVGTTGTPSGFKEFSPAGCIVGSNTTVVVPEGNTRVTCSTLNVNGTLTFEGGNVIFDGDVVLEAGGTLTINACGKEADDQHPVDLVRNSCSPTGATPNTGLISNTWKWGDPFDERQYSSDAAWVLFRPGGSITKAARGSVYIYDATVFLPSDASNDAAKALQLSGGDGLMHWVAPRQGPFDVLSMWSDATNQHDIGGSAGLTMVGVYFAPSAKLYFRGSSEQGQVDAQLLVEKLEAGGGGKVSVTPDIHSSITFKTPPQSVLIR